jgi:DNA-binding NarL/FixJ family response regulator
VGRRGTANDLRLGNWRYPLKRGGEPVDAATLERAESFEFYGPMLKTVVIVEDDKALREELIRILNTAPDVECLGAVSSAEDALQVIPRRPPDTVLMDIKLPKMSGIECVAELKKVLPDLQIIMLTVYEDTEKIFQALRAGASGYLLKSSPPARLFAAIRDVQEGGAPLSSHIARKVVKHFQDEGRLQRETHGLSPRENEVLELLASGYIYKEIADQLQIGIETVRTYVKNICTKMHVRSRVEAVARHRQQR